MGADDHILGLNRPKILKKENNMFKAMLPLLIQNLKPFVLDKFNESEIVEIDEDLFNSKLSEVLPEIKVSLKDGKIEFFKVQLTKEF